MLQYVRVLEVIIMNYDIIETFSIDQISKVGIKVYIIKYRCYIFSLSKQFLGHYRCITYVFFYLVCASKSCWAWAGVEVGRVQAAPVLLQRTMMVSGSLGTERSSWWFACFRESQIGNQTNRLPMLHG
jgi:hypothetical protein